MSALLEPGDTILGLDLAHGGHLTHGMKLNFSGKLYDVAAYHVRRDDHRVDMSEVAELARERRPKLIVAGWSAYPRHLDFAEFRRIADEVGAYLMVDMAHFAGLVAVGLHPSPVPYADVVTTTTHKTLGGPRGGVILSKAEYAKKINSAVFPGQQGGPLEHVIAAKAVAFKIAAVRRSSRSARSGPSPAPGSSPSGWPRPDAAAAGVVAASPAARTSTSSSPICAVGELDGQQAEDRLHSVGITVNRNAVPFDPRPPMVTSGLRIGAPALATRGFGAEDFTEVADVDRRGASALRPATGDDAPPGLRSRVAALAARHPLYPDLGEPDLTDPDLTETVR